MLQLVADHPGTRQAGLSVLAGGLETHVADSIRSIGRDAWNACFPDQVEDYDCLLAIEEAGIAGFEWRYVTVTENGRICAAMPAFLCRYALDTTMDEGMPRRLVRRIRKAFPRFFSLRLACLGSPCTETGAVGFHPEVPATRRAALFSELLTAFERHAEAESCTLVGLKDIDEPTAIKLAAPLEKHGYAAVGGLPTAWLDIDFDSIDSYLARLSPGTRKDMRRKLKSAQLVRVEIRSDIGDWLPRIMALYHDTRNRSELQFEELTPGYFAGLLERMPGRSFCMLYFVGDRLLAANLVVHNGHTFVDKFFCMDGEAGRPYNLYFLSWFTNLAYCLDHGMNRYLSGQAHYENKVRLGSKLTPNLMFFRHRNPLVQMLLRRVSGFFSVDEASS
ncbi:GNAT family N-acetyltransferase [Rhizobium sp. BK251]|uniref:GNAT family N-acetyltransferase n=1 Tax=Rhizobium sp. BK251 TaxID=2512125 RepID=UPI00104DAB20|nr:GNAT family N-acetyltransferase [Rhizobium sp. BK251]TCL71788.1 putative N-acyltransferase [Rhizobium sp. BK251]